MNRSLFIKFRDLIYTQSGINIGEKKESLLISRIGKRMRTLGIEDYEVYYQKVAEDSSGCELVELIDAVSTNVTHFFREPQHFDFLSEKIEEWLAKGKRKFKIWCAASSSGEEPYTIAMIMEDKCNSYNVNYRILATDICTKVLQKAMNGEYEAEKLVNVPPKYRTAYFEKNYDEDKNLIYKVKSFLKERITFARLNLAKPPFPMQGPFDVIFIRNVMIYFDNIVRTALLEEAYRLLGNGGYLIVGHAESLTGMLNSKFKRIQPSIYTKEE